MKRKYSPFHDFWHKRVEGQIRHAIGQHPEWFSFKDDVHKSACVNSLAKRIVGEIVAARTVASVPSRVSQKCNGLVGDNDVVGMSLSDGGVRCGASPLTKGDS